MYCPNCGKRISDDSKFCSYCGYRVEKSSLFSDSSKAKGKDGELIQIGSARKFKAPLDLIAGCLLVITVLLDIKSFSFYHIEQGILCIYLLYSAFFWYKYYKNIFLSIALFVIGIFLNPFTRLTNNSNIYEVLLLSGILLIITSGCVYYWRLKKEVEKDLFSIKQKWFSRVFPLFMIALILLIGGGMVYERLKPPTPSLIIDPVGNRIISDSNGSWVLQANPDLVFLGDSEGNGHYYNIKTKRKYSAEEIKKFYPKQAAKLSDKKENNFWNK